MLTYTRPWMVLQTEIDTEMKQPDRNIHRIEITQDLRQDKSWEKLQWEIPHNIL